MPEGTRGRERCGFQRPNDLRQFPDASIICPMQAAAEVRCETQVVIVGVGLIGGSIAAALRRRQPACRITGIGRSVQRLQRASQAGLLDDYAVEISAAACPAGSLVVVCLPVDHIAQAVRQLAAVAAGETLITDAGSVKSLIYRSLQDDATARRRYVGAHPIAGSEQAGFEHALPGLFEKRICIVTPEGAAAADVQRVRSFWAGLGSEVRLMTAEEHDRVLALTSHLPHVLASVAASCVTPELLAYTGTGFRDTTRIAAGDAELWSQILCGNREHVVCALQSAEQLLVRLREHVAAGDGTAVRLLLQQAAAIRGQLQLPAVD